MSNLLSRLANDFKIKIDIRTISDDPGSFNGKYCRPLIMQHFDPEKSDHKNLNVNVKDIKDELNVLKQKGEEDGAAASQDDDYDKKPGS